MGFVNPSFEFFVTRLFSIFDNLYVTGGLLFPLFYFGSFWLFCSWYASVIPFWYKSGWRSCELDG